MDPPFHTLPSARATELKCAAAPASAAPGLIFLYSQGSQSWWSPQTLSLEGPLVPPSLQVIAQPETLVRVWRVGEGRRRGVIQTRGLWRHFLYQPHSSFKLTVSSHSTVESDGPGRGSHCLSQCTQGWRVAEGLDGTAMPGTTAAGPLRGTWTSPGLGRGWPVWSL